MAVKRFIVALSLLLASCGPTPHPSSRVWDFSISISDQQHGRVPHALVTIDGQTKEANDFGWAYSTLGEGCHVYSVSKDGFKPTGDQNVCLSRATRTEVILESDLPPAPPTTRLEAKGKIFYQNDQPWRWRGVTAFGLESRYCNGEDIQPFLDAYKGYNLLRVFLYVEWPGTGWTAPSDDCQHRFLNYTAERGWYVELVALTGSKPLPEAQAIVDHLFSDFAAHTNLLIELVNEPGIHDKVDPARLTVPQTPVLWTDGLTVDGHRGFYLTPHTPRDSEWARKAHDLLEYYNGGGPGSPSDPAFKQPAVGDEPAKGEDVGFVANDFKAYAATASLLGAGATFHCESCKYGKVPTPQEAEMAKAFLEGLQAFPADAPLGPYSRIDGGSLRTYVVGGYAVRVRPTTPDFPGWTPLDDSGIIFRRN